jgi:hypothetical protein
MAQTTFDVLVIRKGRMADYRLFWEQGTEVNEQGVELKSDELSFNVLVEAKNLHEAVRIVQKTHPDDSVSRVGSRRLGKP